MSKDLKRVGACYGYVKLCHFATGHSARAATTGPITAAVHSYWSCQESIVTIEYWFLAFYPGVGEAGGE